MTTTGAIVGAAVSGTICVFTLIFIWWYRQRRYRRSIAFDDSTVASRASVGQSFGLRRLRPGRRSANSGSIPPRTADPRSLRPDALASDLPERPSHPQSAPPHMMIPPSQTASSPDEVVPPKVNPRFQRIRDENFQRKVAEGYSPSQAMSVSAGTEREEDDIDPLRSSGVQTTEGGRSKYAVLTEHIHQPQAAFMGSTIQGGPNALRDRSPSEERRAKLQRDQMPSNVIPQGRAAVPRPQQRSRWLTSPDEILSAAEDVHRSLHPTVLQIQAPRGVVTAARSLTEDGTSTQASTLISEDPWREEAHDNRRLGR